MEGVFGRARRRAVGTRTPILVEARANARWSLDFVYDQLAPGRRFRVLNVVDDVTRECLAAIPDTSISGKRVARELTAVIERRGKPQMIVSDNGTEFTSNAILSWTEEQRRVALHRARQADAERLYRILQRTDARRASQRDALPRSRPGSAAHQRLGRRLQHGKAALFAWLPDAGGLCRPTDCANQRNNRRGSNRRWMKLQWQVSHRTSPVRISTLRRNQATDFVNALSSTSYSLTWERARRAAWSDQWLLSWSNLRIRLLPIDSERFRQEKRKFTSRKTRRSGSQSRALNSPVIECGGVPTIGAMSVDAYAT